MSDFYRAIDVVLRHEGGWVDDPDDPGGETNFGISMKFIREQGLRADDLGLADFSPGALKKLTVEKAKHLYEHFFWNPLALEWVNDQTIATKIFDCAVNCGAKRASMLAQQAAIVCGQWVVVDGVLGPKSFGAINACGRAAYLGAYAEEMAGYYRALVERRPALRKFLRNWLSRAAWPGLVLQPVAPKGTTT